MWWRRRPEGSLGIPAPRVPEFRIGTGLMIGIVALALLFPVLGASVLILALTTWLFRKEEASHA